MSTFYLEPLIKAHQPDLWIHGHTHTSFDYRVGRCRVLCNPRGYRLSHMPVPENQAFDAARVVTPVA